MRNHLLNDCPSILVIDADPDARRTLRGALSAEHYLLREATGVGDGMTQIAALRPDLVLLDPSAPDVPGLELIRQIRWAKHNCPIIVLSARSDERYRIEALDMGADDFMAKPLAIGELLARIRVALRRATAACSQ